ncbi:DUF481 domain-containing protein [Sedimentisphaera salicampi]|uniref:DUF481 domain-containing protein n=1 Tax=Sedimentisphaera salicampi TaxID=1941349 RepID=UPI000B9BC996|nr:DUF481 domain-containing protein [Sedimentisphaera salicampi]OXU15812.1 putative salt-induced outer membrane protein [Sedimentisphaera salicampi]
MKKLLTIAALALFAASVNADVVYLTNGDKISGKVQTVGGGKMKIASELAGDIEIALENVSSFETKEPVEMHLKDGSTLNQPVEKGSEGCIQTKETELLKPQKLKIDSISSVNPPAPEKPRWKGSISGGVSVSSGNTDKTDYNLSAYMQKRTEQDRITLSADYAQSEQTNDDTGEERTTEEWWKTRAKFDYFLSKKLYAFIDGRYETDKIADLDRRVLIGGGLGYQWIESAAMNFSTDLGVASRYEKYDNEPDSSTELSGQASYHFDKQMMDNLMFIHELTFYPSFESLSDEYYVSTFAELKYQMTDAIFASFKSILDYDKSPAAGTESTDKKYMFSIGVDF